MCGGSIYYIDQAGTHIPPVFEWKKQIKFLAQVFGNTTFVFIYHHSISGIIAPVRPQSSIHSMFMWSNIVGSVCLGTEGLLAWFAFGSLKNFCVKPHDMVATDFHPEFPCKVSGLYNQNFLNLPGIGQICNFYPMLNVAAVPILNITLRNNILDVFPIKDFLRRNNFCVFLTEDHKNSVKGMWSIILSIPCIMVALCYRNI